MGRRHRDQQPGRGEPAGAAPARRPARRSGRRTVDSSRYFVDLAGILGIALLLNIVLREVGMINVILRIIVALVVARLVVTLVRRSLESRR